MGELYYIAKTFYGGEAGTVSRFSDVFASAWTGDGTLVPYDETITEHRAAARRQGLPLSPEHVPEQA